MYNPVMEVPVPTTEEVGLDINNLLEERHSLKRMKEDCDSRLKQIDEEIGKKLDEKDAKTVRWGDYLVIRRAAAKGRAILDRVLLLEAGVTPQQLKAATIYGDPGKAGVTVRPIAENPAKQSSGNGEVRSSQLFATERLD